MVNGPPIAARSAKSGRRGNRNASASMKSPARGLLTLAARFRQGFGVVDQADDPSRINVNKQPPEDIPRARQLKTSAA